MVVVVVASVMSLWRASVSIRAEPTARSTVPRTAGGCVQNGRRKAISRTRRIRSRGVASQRRGLAQQDRHRFVGQMGRKHRVQRRPLAHSAAAVIDTGRRRICHAVDTNKVAKTDTVQVYVCLAERLAGLKLGLLHGGPDGGVTRGTSFENFPGPAVVFLLFCSPRDSHVFHACVCALHAVASNRLWLFHNHHA